MKKRELIKRIIYEPAKSRIKRGECPACGLHKDEWTRRKDWRCCSVECTEKFFKEMYSTSCWADVREKVLKRDNYACVKCGDNRKEVEVITKQKRIKNMNEFLSGKEKAKYEFHDFKHMMSNFIGDHIKPISLGGDEWDLNNIQTLCLKCNKIKTKEDQKLIAKQRRIEKKLINGQKQLK